MNKTVIAIFCYKRASKLKKSVEALLKNPECASMDVIFFSDGYKSENDKDGVLATRAYIDGLTGFRNIYKEFRPHNFSTGPNFQQGLTYLANNFDQFIVVEDDLVVSSNYLKFMLDGLAYYRDAKQVFSVSGYCFPLKKSDYPYDSVIHTRFSCYGWASWSDRVSKVIWDKNALSELIRTSPNFKKRLDSEGMDLSRILDKQISGKISTWDIQMQVQVSENKLKVVYPVISKTTNIGFDEESTNTFGINYLKTEIDTTGKRIFNFCDVDISSPEIQRQLKQPYSLPALATRKIINTVIKIASQFKKAAM